MLIECFGFIEIQWRVFSPSHSIRFLAHENSQRQRFFCCDGNLKKNCALSVSH